MKNISLKKRILIPLGLALVVLSGAFSYNTYQDEYKHISQEIKEKHNSVKELLYRNIKSDVLLLSSTIDMLSINPQIQAAWLARDRTALLKITSPLLLKLRDKFRTTHLYFHDTNNINFVRIHKPEFYGDTIDRGTLIRAKESGQVSSGLELGPLGTFSLRVVCPWRIDDQLVGYIEMAKNIEHIKNKLHDVLNVELIITVPKKSFIQIGEATVEPLVNYKKNWDLLPSSVVVSQTFKEIPKNLIHLLSKEPSETFKKMTQQELKVNGRLYRSGFFPLLDAGIASVKEVGSVAVLYDVTNRVRDIHGNFIRDILISAIIATILFLLFSKILGQTEKLLENSSLEIIKSRDELETRVKERTAELKATHDQLLHAEKLSALGKLSASMAHEFNNPLYGIKMTLEDFIGRKDLNESERKSINLAMIECKRISRLINGLQDFYRPSDDVRTIIDINLLIDEVLQICKQKLKADGVVVVKDFGRDLPEISVVDDQIKQVIMNLIINAEEAVSHPGGAIDIKTRISENKLNMIRIVFEDNGSGITKENLDRIFEPFFTTKSSVKGTGLGLSVSYGIIKKHGGEILVESTPNKGSLFTVELPI